MIELLIIADDFTGALDTGVQFAAHGATTRVVVDGTFDPGYAAADVQVLVLDAETRHRSPREAYEAVFRIVASAVEARVPFIYKKTDSGLRGNIGSELAAVLDAAEAKVLPFIPAFPAMNRTTRKGVHYVEGLPVAQSVFGRDPFEPVKFSDVRSVIAQQTERRSAAVEVGQEPVGWGIHVYDAETDDDLLRIGRSLGREGLRLSAGCAGFASVLVDILGLRGNPPEVPRLPSSFLVVCGSVNPVTRLQMDCAEQCGFWRVRLNMEQKLDPSWLESGECASSVQDWLLRLKQVGRMILESGDPEEGLNTQRFAAQNGLSMERVRVGISSALATLTKALMDSGLNATLMSIGGDTLLALMQAVGVRELVPVCEVAEGVVLTSFRYGSEDYCIVTKSGGFGEPDLLCRLAERLQSGKKENSLCWQNTT